MAQDPAESGTRIIPTLSAPRRGNTALMRMPDAELISVPDVLFQSFFASDSFFYLQKKPAGSASPSLQHAHTRLPLHFFTAMKKIRFLVANGAIHEVYAAPGQTLMQVATANNVPGIDADCGGSCICATCHVFIPAGAMASLAPPDDTELTMLECAVGYEPARSRLSCQLLVDTIPDELEISVPATQR